MLEPKVNLKQKKAMKKLLDQHKIVANENILSSVLDGEKIVEKGTTLDYVGSQLSWDYYRAPTG